MHAHRPNLANLPSELIAEIAIRLPYDADIRHLGLACKSAATTLIFSTIEFARRHLRTQLESSAFSSVWEFLEMTGLTYAKFLALPVNHLAVLFAAVLAADEWKGVHSVDDAYGPGNWMFFKRWLMPGALATRVYRILSHDLRRSFDMRCQMNRPFRWAARCGYLDIVQDLIKRPGIDPGDDHDYALRTAAEAGHLSVVVQLLADPRVTPSGGDNGALHYSAEHGHTDIVRLLMDSGDPGVDPGSEMQYCIIYASAGGHSDTVQFLLQDNRVDPAAASNYAVKQAARNGHAAVLALLLADRRVDPSSNRQFALKRAARHGHAECVSILLRHPRVDPMVDGGSPLSLAAEFGQVEAVKVLLADARVIPEAGEHDAWKRAIESRHWEVANLLRAVDSSYVLQMARFDDDDDPFHGRDK
ncbi:ankyrin repeat-containing domain protein [Chytriomyces sp. MP71]|nr:ankyrin repeat-containing domain protein [Chytriomyces sp. MP71]